MLGKQLLLLLGVGVGDQPVQRAEGFVDARKRIIELDREPANCPRRGRSATKSATAGFRPRCLISVTVRSPLSRVRHTMATWAPDWASATAVSFPIPELAPVTIQVFRGERVGGHARATREQESEPGPPRYASRKVEGFQVKAP